MDTLAEGSWKRAGRDLDGWPREGKWLMRAIGGIPPALWAIAAPDSLASGWRICLGIFVGLLGAALSHYVVRACLWAVWTPRKQRREVLDALAALSPDEALRKWVENQSLPVPPHGEVELTDIVRQAAGLLQRGATAGDVAMELLGKPPGRETLVELEAVLVELAIRGALVSTRIEKPMGLGGSVHVAYRFNLTDEGRALAQSLRD